MRTCYILEYKYLDTKGREKNPKHVGVFKTLEQIDKKKNEILSSVKEKLTFQVYVHESVF